MVSRLSCNMSRWPLVLLDAPVRWGAETIARYAQETSRCVAQGEPFAMILDLTQSALLPLATRDLLAAHRRWLFARGNGMLVCEAIVATSRAQREFFRLPEHDESAAPQLFCGSLEQAVMLVADKLRQRGIVIESIAPRDSGVRFRPPRRALRNLPQDLPDDEVTSISTRR